MDFFPPSDTPNIKTYETCAALVPFTTCSLAYHDLTGRFPHRSTRGNQYLLIIYDFDSNAILHVPLKTKTGAEIKKDWIQVHQRLTNGGNAPSTYIMDNEISADLKSHLTQKKITYQLNPPHVHRRNAAERAIRTFKNHYLSCLATCDPEFPISEWDRLG